MMACRSNQPLVIVSPSGQIASYFDNSAEAAKLLSISKTCIDRALRTGGFYLKRKWVYESEYCIMWMSGRHHEYAYDYKKYKSEAIKKSYQRKTESQKNEIKKKQSEVAKRNYAQKGAKHPLQIKHQQNCKPVICETTGERFESLKAFALKYNLHESDVSRAIKDGRDIKGMIVRFE